MTSVRRLADTFLDEMATLDPTSATAWGIVEHDQLLTDHSPDAADQRQAVRRRTLAELDRLADDAPGGGRADHVVDRDAQAADRRCACLLRDRLGVDIALHDAGEHLRNLRIIGSPVGSTRAVFDLMPTATPEDLEIVAERLDAVPDAYRSIVASLEAGRASGAMAARRQAEANAAQVATWAGLHGEIPWFEGFVAQTPATGVLRGRLVASAERATRAMVETHTALLDYAAAAPTHDPVGADRYALYARKFLGMHLDAPEAYGWAWDELARIEAEMASVAAQIVPGGTIDEAMEWLDRHGQAVEGEAALVDYLQQLMDEAIATLDGRHVTIDPRVKVVEAMIAPPGSAAAQYYTAPSADFARPGRTWYPTLGATRFPTWAEVSTCYHEGVPGHHLQLAQWRVEAQRLSRFQTTVTVSGNIEGWALYAERLMDELGLLADPGERLGYLVAQQLRATRVIVDIGMHLELVIPAGQPFRPGQRWTPELGLEFLLAHGGKSESFLRSEWVRYLGWPAQAISYKLGERVWLAGRDAARTVQGSQFDLRAWHDAALAMGSLGLDDLAVELAAR